MALMLTIGTGFCGVAYCFFTGAYATGCVCVAEFALADRWLLLLSLFFTAVAFGWKVTCLTEDIPSDDLIAGLAVCAS